MPENVSLHRLLDWHIWKQLSLLQHKHKGEKSRKLQVLVLLFCWKRIHLCERWSIGASALVENIQIHQTVKAETVFLFNLLIYPTRLCVKYCSQQGNLTSCKVYIILFRIKNRKSKHLSEIFDFSKLIIK